MPSDFSKKYTSDTLYLIEILSTYSAMAIQAPDAYKIAIIVADMGKISRTTRRALSDLPENTTYAFSPFGQGINGWAEQARRANHETLLMIPM